MYCRDITRKRLVAVHRAEHRLDDTVAELRALLDILYTDVEGCVELADIYEQAGPHAAALQNLSHALLLRAERILCPAQRGDRHAHASDLLLASKMHLLMVDMLTPDDTDPHDGRAVLCAHRTCLGRRQIRQLFLSSRRRCSRWLQTSFPLLSD